MSYDALLTNTCTIKRFVEGAKDAYNRPTKTWPNHLVDEPCRYSTPRNREIKVGQEVVLIDLELFLRDVDVTVQDRVVLEGTTYEILEVRKRQDSVSGHHKELAIRAIK